MSSSNWYSNPDAVLEQFRITSAGRGVTPVIAGYDDLVEVKRGGQGVVYSATQRSTRRRVAIKLLLDGAFASEQNRRRFEREIDVVGALRNPHIVGIYDSGVSSDGHPYFVMEFVDGAPLDQFLLDASLSNPGLDRKSTTSGDARARVRRLLDLFLPICEAVQYAHQRGVIHRDLKPGNIRVDSDGRPRVLDFGLARAFQPGGEQGDATELTLSGQFMGSLHWASPEHASGNPDAIDTRSDVYSLGVILYFVLTGRFPYSVQGSLRDVLDNILHAEPARPSEFALGIDADLETIVLKCLAKEPQRRYQSAGELADDVRRYLASEPIQARRDSTWYTLRKLLRRYRWAAAAALLVLILITTGLIVSLSLWRRAEHQRSVADAEGRTAERRTRQYGAVNDFLTGMLSSVDPTEKKGRDVRVADLLDQATKSADEKLADEPMTQFAVRMAVSKAYVVLGLHKDAQRQLETALQIAQEHLPPDDLERISVGQLLAQVHQRQGHYVEAETMWREALESLEKRDGQEHQRTISAASDLAHLLADRGQFDESEAMARQTLEARQRVLGPEHRETMESMNFLAGCLMRKGAFKEARELYEQTLELRLRVLGEDHSETINSMSDLAVVLGDLGEDEQSEALYSRAYELMRSAYGEEHFRTLLVMHNLALARLRLKRGDEAVEMLQHCVEAERRVLGPKHPASLTTKSSLASAYKATGRLEEAEQIMRDITEAAPELLGSDHPNTLTFLAVHGNMLLNLKRPAEAEPLFRTAYAGALRSLGESHWLTQCLQGNIGQVLMIQKKYEEAEPLLLTSYEALLKSVGAEHEYALDTVKDIVRLYEDWNKPDKAAEYRKLLQQN